MRTALLDRPEARLGLLNDDGSINTPPSVSRIAEVALNYAKVPLVLIP